MKTVLNKSRMPLKIRLARGKVLRLGPGKEGQIATPDADRESVRMLVESGDLQIFDEGDHPSARAGAADASRPDSRGPHAGTVFKKGGDR